MQKRTLKIDSPKSANGRICVYRIWFGDAFYIGSSTRLKARLREHVWKILKCFSGLYVGDNSQTRIMNYLSDHPEITEGMVEILDFVNEEHELVHAEKRWMDSLFSNPKCLNYSNKTSRLIGGVVIRPKYAEKV